jgi:predicted ATP-dependent endonuclease of OLD family
MLKLLSLEFHDNGFRKLRNLKLEFADRITLIAGHNGIGKSTILGLIASTSGLKDNKSYFNKTFSSVIHEIIHLDPVELKEEKLTIPWPKIIYKNNSLNIEHWKNTRITKRGEERLRSVPSTESDSPDKDLTGQDEKIPLPTLYLGMVRMLPIGESSALDVESEIESMNETDHQYFTKFINSVIGGTAVGDSKGITNQSIKNTKKNSKHPTYLHSTKSVSLGQDSLSNIATAIASFNRLKRELGDKYPGGLLVIDEIDSGFHPHAQQKLIDALSTAANQLFLQIIGTTHSPRLIEYVHPDSLIRDNKQRKGDKVIYLADTTTPRLVDWSLEGILDDMSLSLLKPNKITALPEITAYLEDDEAAKFLKGILGMSRNLKNYGIAKNKKNLRIIPIGVGGSNLLNLPKHDNHFKKVLLIVDGDITISSKITNAIRLPAEKSNNGTGYNPERTIYIYIKELAKGDRSKYSNTYEMLFKERITTDRLIKDFLSSEVNITERDSAKKWFKAVYKKLMQYKLFKFWAADHKDQMDIFIKQLEQKLDELLPKK